VAWPAPSRWPIRRTPSQGQPAGTRTTWTAEEKMVTCRAPAVPGWHGHGPTGTSFTSHFNETRVAIDNVHPPPTRAGHLPRPAGGLFGGPMGVWDGTCLAGRVATRTWSTALITRQGLYQTRPTARQDRDVTASDAVRGSRWLHKPTKTLPIYATSTVPGQSAATRSPTCFFQVRSRRFGCGSFLNHQC